MRSAVRPRGREGAPTTKKLMAAIRFTWMGIYGKRGSSFEDESEYILLLDGTIQM